MKREPNISRLDNDRTRGWWVRFQRGKSEGKRNLFSKLFSDAVHGGKRAALKQAIAWRNEWAGLVPPSRRHTHEVPVGYGYVRRQMLWRRAAYHDVCLAWIRVADGGNKSTSYSVSRWGETGAHRKCERWLAERRSELGLTASGRRRAA